jgi:hypothetical protein
MTEIIHIFHIKIDNAREPNILPVEMPREALQTCARERAWDRVRKMSPLLMIAPTLLPYS